ncbi:MAG TPA: YdcF family protein [Desulfuromonadaceae bacterium]|jgi:uncharacterized SAM-binding protein YcdF (DUF218 family)
MAGEAGMFELKKCISAFLLPPGVFVLILIAASFYGWRLRRWGAALGSLCLALLIWSLSTALVSEALLASLEKGFSIPARPAGDVIVLLGGGIHDKVPDLTGSGTPSEGMMPRLVTAVRLQRQRGVPILISGGATFKGRTPEAPVVRRFLIDLGVPEKNILVDDKSRDTMENARFSRQIILKHHFQRPLLVTSAFHMRRSVEAFRQVGIVVIPVPAGFVTSPERSRIWADFLPESGALHASSTVLKEYLGLLFYRALRTLSASLILQSS